MCDLFTVYLGPFIGIISYISSLPLANDKTVLGLLSSPISLSPTLMSSTFLIDPLYIRIGVPNDKHFPAPQGSDIIPPPFFLIDSKHFSTIGFCFSLNFPLKLILILFSFIGTIFVGLPKFFSP